MKLLLNKEEVAKILVDHFFNASINCSVTAKITPHGDSIAIVEVTSNVDKAKPPFSNLQEALDTALQRASDPLNSSTYEEGLKNE